MTILRNRRAAVLAILAISAASALCVSTVNAGFRGAHGHRSCERNEARLERNKQTVVAFYTTAFNDGDPVGAVERYIGVDENGAKTYTQHNPYAVDGPQGFIDFVTGLKAQFPDAHVDIVRVIAEGDLVITHSHLTSSPSDRGRAAADIFRIDDDGKVVEHWDVLQEIPETSANGNGMF